MPAPPGVVANFDNPESIAYRVVIISVLGAVIAAPACLLRLYTKRTILRNVGWDDYSIALATVFAIGFSIYVGYQTSNCLGIHIWDCPAPKFYTLMKIGGLVGPMLFNGATMFTKISLGLFYLRLSPFKTSFRIAVYTVMCVSILNSTLNGFGFAWVCQPIQKYWDLSISTGKCINLDQYFLAAACINAATDWALLVLPIFILHSLQLPLRRKASAAMLLMTGSFVCVVSLIRVEQIIRGMRVVPTDGTWGMAGNFIWMLVEVWLGIICTCLPILYTFLRTQLLARRAVGRQGTEVVVQDSNNRQVIAQAQDDSGYYTGHTTEVRMDRLDVEGSEQRPSHEYNGRPAASNKSLLISAERCDD